MHGKQDCEMQNKEVQGQPTPFDPSWEGPMKVTRRKTDPRALKFYWIFLTVWIGIGIYAFGSINGHPPKQQLNVNDFGHYSQPQQIKNSFHEEKTYSWTLIFKITESEVHKIFVELPSKAFLMMIYNFVGYGTTLGCSILTTFLSVIFIAIFGNHAKIFVKGILGLLCLLAILGIIVSISVGKGMILLLGISLIFLSAIVMIIKKFNKEIDLSHQIIKVACKIVFFSPYHFVLPFVQFLLSFSALMFFFNNIRLLSNAYNNFYSRGVAFDLFCFFLHLGNFLGWIWSSNFINGVKDMILAGSFSTCSGHCFFTITFFTVWTINKEHVQKDTVQNFASIVQRYHLGTSAAGSTFMSICDLIKFFLIFIGLATFSNYDLSLICAWFSCCGICLLYLVMCASREAYATAVLFGTDFSTSGKNTYRLIRRNAKKFVITCVSLLFFTTVSFLVVFISILVTYNGLPNRLNIEEFDCYVITLVFIYMLASSFFNLLECAVNTVSVSTLVDYEQNDGSQARPYYMSDDLKKLMVN